MKIQKLIKLVTAIVLLVSFGSVDLTVANYSPQIPPSIVKDSFINKRNAVDGPYVPSFGVETKDFLTLSQVDGGAGEPDNHWVRINGLLWSDVQPDNDQQWLWDNSLDKKLQDTYDAGMETILIVRSTPEWARFHDYFCGPMGPSYLDEFADFMAGAVERYSNPPEPYTYTVKFYEIWNEPDDIRQEGLENNVHGCWGDENDEYWGGEYYGDVLQAIYPEVKAANSEAQIVVGGLLLPCDPATGVDYCNMSHFFEGILQTDKTDDWPYFDYVAFHGYPYYDPTLSTIQQEIPNDPVGDELYWPGWNDQGGLVEGKLNFVMSVMLDYEIDKPILLTECGLTDPNNKASDPAALESFEATKADYLVWLYSRNIARGINGTIWYYMDSYGWQKSGLLDETNTPLPAYNAYAVLTSALDGAVYLRDLDNLGDGVLGFEFKKDNRIWVVFSEDDTQKTITEPEWLSSIYDLFGNPVVPTAGEITFNKPIYIEFENALPVADNQELITDEDEPLNVLLTADDIDGDDLTWYIVTPPTHGSLSGIEPNITYTPNANFNGNDSFTFKVNDGIVDSNVATISITVNAVNDAPVANNQNVTTDEDVPLNITLSADDIDGDDLTWHIVTPPTHGSLSGIEPNITYTPNANFNGNDNFTFKVDDGIVDSNVATISITVNAVNDQPVAVNDSYGVFINETLTIDPPGVLDNDMDVDGDLLTSVNFSDPSHGTLTQDLADGSFVYVPDEGYLGPDTFTYQADDGNLENNLSTEATVTITVMDTSCLAVEPELLEKSLNPDTSGTSSLTLTNLCDYDVPFTLEEWELTLQEGFEGGLIPSDWETRYVVPSTWQWIITDNPDWVFEGQNAAWFNFDVNYADGWLLTPVLDTSTFSDLTISFMAFSDTREDREARVEVWVTDEAGNEITKFWDMRDENWEYPPEYRQVIVDLSDYASYSDPIRIAWRYVGQRGQSFGLDSIEIQASTDVPWLSADPAEHIVPAGEILPITIRFDSTGMAIGDYHAGFNLDSYLSPVIPVPVTLHVGVFGFEYFLPLILR